MSQPLPEWVKPYLAQADKIIKMPEPQRTQYVTQVILSLVPAIRKVMQAPLTQKKQIIDKLIEEWSLKSHILLPAIFYSIKPEFLPAYLEIMTAIGAPQKT